MNTISSPMTPSECDLRGYEWMPLFGARLFASNFEAHASDLAFRVAIKLYWECWQQVPAASLPNEDVQLCRLAGLGRDLKTWRKLRADGVLHGFRLCSDDRLYHPMLAEEAIKAWECRRDRQEDRKTSTERMRRWRQERGGNERAWAALRQEILARDDNRCTRCGATDGLHCDHIISLAHGGDNDPDNLTTLCRRCHSSKTASEQNPKKPNGDASRDALHSASQKPPDASHERTTNHVVTHDVTSRAKDSSTGQVQQVQEERKESSKNTFLSSRNVPARGSREQNPVPDGLAELLAEEGIEPPNSEPEEVPNVIDILDARNAASEELGQTGAVGAQIRRAAKALAMRIPYAEVRSVEAQLDALRPQPAVVGADEAMGLKWAPADPVRSVQEQAAAMLAGCTSEQIAKAQRYAARYASPVSAVA